jgi:hypothetical protein
MILAMLTRPNELSYILTFHFTLEVRTDVSKYVVEKFARIISSPQAVELFAVPGVYDDVTTKLSMDGFVGSARVHPFRHVQGRVVVWLHVSTICINDGVAEVGSLKGVGQVVASNHFIPIVMGLGSGGCIWVLYAGYVESSSVQPLRINPKRVRFGFRVIDGLPFAFSMHHGELHKEVVRRRLEKMGVHKEPFLLFAHHDGDGFRCYTVMQLAESERFSRWTYGGPGLDGFL